MFTKHVSNQQLAAPVRVPGSKHKYVIAFDDINDGAPEVYVDGHRVKGIMKIDISWLTSEEGTHHNLFRLKHYVLSAEGEPKLITIEQPE